MFSYIANHVLNKVYKTYGNYYLNVKEKYIVIPPKVNFIFLFLRACCSLARFDFSSAAIFTGHYGVSKKKILI